MELVLQPAFVTGLVLTLVLLSVLSGINRLGSNTFYDKQYMSRDISLLVSSALTAPDNVYFLYSHSKNFSINISKEGEVSVFKDSPKDPELSNYFFIPGSLDFHSDNLNNVEYILISKTKNNLDIFNLDRDVHPNFHYIDCEKSGIALGSIIVDPVPLYKPDDTFQISTFFDTSTKSDLDQKVDLEYRNSQIKSSDTILSFAFDDDNSKNNNLKAYYNIKSSNAKSSKSLACNILNSLSGTFAEFIDSATLIPFNPEQISKNDDRQILDNDKIGVYLIIGNIQSGEQLNINLIGEQIKNGLKNY